MSFLLCPTCGRNVSLKHFDPSSLELDVMTQDMKGLGKGKGFEGVGRGSILGKNEVCQQIAERSIALLNLFLENDIVSEDEVRTELGLTEDSSAVEREGQETQALREEREDTENRIRAVTSKIAEALGEDVDEYECDDDEVNPVVGRLEYFADRLMDEYGATTDSEGMSMIDKIDQITNEVADALGQSAGDFTPEGDEDDTPVSRLSHYVRLVIDEFTASKENQEGRW